MIDKLLIARYISSYIMFFIFILCCNCTLQCSCCCCLIKRQPWVKLCERLTANSLSSSWWARYFRNLEIDVRRLRNNTEEIGIDLHSKWVFKWVQTSLPACGKTVVFIFPVQFIKIKTEKNVQLEKLSTFLALCEQSKCHLHFIHATWGDWKMSLWEPVADDEIEIRFQETTECEP